MSEHTWLPYSCPYVKRVPHHASARFALEVVDRKHSLLEGKDRSGETWKELGRQPALTPRGYYTTNQRQDTDTFDGTLKAVLMPRWYSGWKHRMPSRRRQIFRRHRSDSWSATWTSIPSQFHMECRTAWVQSSECRFGTSSPSRNETD